MHSLTMTEEKQNIESFFFWRLEFKFIRPEQRVRKNTTRLEVGKGFLI